MYLDAYNTYSSAQALNASARSTNVIDHQATRNLGNGEPMALVVLVTTAADHTTGDETYTAKLQADGDEAFGSAADITPEYTIPRTAIAGQRYVIPLPPGVTVERYTSVYYTLGGTTPTLSVTSWLAPMSMVGTSGENTFVATRYTIAR